jgi:hypothetical protein
MLSKKERVVLALEGRECQSEVFGQVAMHRNEG